MSVVRVCCEFSWRIRQSLRLYSFPNVAGVFCVRRVGSSLFPQRAISTTHWKTLKNCAFVDNTGHFDNEFNLAASEGLDGLNVDNIKRHKIISSSPLNVRHDVIVPVSGRRLSSCGHTASNATVLFLMSFSFTKQVLAQLDLLKYWKETTACKTVVHVLPKQLDEQVATWHLAALGAARNVPTEEPALSLLSVWSHKNECNSRPVGSGEIAAATCDLGQVYRRAEQHWTPDLGNLRLNRKRHRSNFTLTSCVVC